MRILLLALFVTACRTDPGSTSLSAEPKRGAPPPTVQSAGANVAASCNGGAGVDKVATRVFPAEVSTFCLESKGTLYGEGGEPIKGICGPFDGECEVYLGLGVDRVVQVRYVDRAGTAATIEINFSRFGTPEQAYAMFTKRTVGDTDPADDSAPRFVDAGGAGALGTGNAYLWRGRYLAELTYADASANEQAIQKAGDEVLPKLLEAAGSAIEGDKVFPASVALLPTEERLPLWNRYIVGDLLGAKGAGAGALGYHRTSDGHRYRSLVIVRDDESQAKSALAALSDGGTDEPKVGAGGRSATRADGKLSIAWVFARKGTHVFGVGDESRVLRVGMKPGEAEKLNLPVGEKIDRLKRILR